MSKNNMAINICENQIIKQLLPSSVCNNHLNNPRGLAFNQLGELMLVEAGGGEAAPPYRGRLTIRDKGSFAVKRQWLSGFKAFNLQARMHRDEVMGLSDIAPTESNSWLVTYTDYVDGSKIFEVQDGEVALLFSTQGNINSLCFNPHSQSWFCVKPDSNEVVEFRRNQPERTLCKIPELYQGVDAVPVTIIYQHASQKLLVTLFSGELNKNPELKGIEFNKRQGRVITIDPYSGAMQTLVRGLTCPTALCLDKNDNLLVTELCSDFLQPLTSTQHPKHALHGGFKRFSGRLLRIDKNTNHVEELASHLDTPSNIAVYDNDVYISEGMGLPGRLIPTPAGVKPLRGFIRLVDTQSIPLTAQNQRQLVDACGAQ